MCVKMNPSCVCICFGLIYVIKMKMWCSDSQKNESLSLLIELRMIKQQLCVMLTALKGEKTYFVLLFDRIMTVKI